MKERRVMDNIDESNERALRECLTDWRDKIPGLRPSDGFVYAGKEDFVLRHGRIYLPQSPPRRYRRGRIKQCFDNSYRLSKRLGLRYVEGFAVANGFPLHHAWCIDRDDRVIDVTWSQPSECYFGVVLPLRYLVESKGDGVLDDWPNKWQFFTVPFKQQEESS